MQRSNRIEWPSWRPQYNRSPEQTRRQEGAELGQDHHPGAQVATPDEAPHTVRYEDENTGTYVVREPNARQVLVPKARTAAEPSPIEGGQQTPASRLMRWSAIALMGVALGGIGGIVLGLPVVIVAAVRLADHARHVRRWRGKHAGPHGVPPLPAPASTERLRLRTAFWQGLVALVFGAVVLVFLSGRVL